MRCARLRTPEIAAGGSLLPEVPYVPPAASGLMGTTASKRARQGAVLREYKLGASSWREAAARAGVNISSVEQWYAKRDEWWIRAKAEAEYDKGLQTDADRKPVPDFDEFSREYCPLPEGAGGTPIPEHQQEWLDAWKWAEERGNWSRVLLLEPPDSGKTTFCENAIAHLVCRNPKIRIKIASKTGAIANKRLRRIKGLLAETRPPGEVKSIATDFGPFKPTRGESELAWSREMIYVSGSDAANRDPTVEALGVGSQIYGGRADLILLDDIADIKNQASPTEREKQVEWVKREVMSRLDPKRGFLVAIGTRVHEEDVYSLLMQDLLAPDRDAVKIIMQPAILNEQEKRVLWPERYPYEKLAEIREDMGPRSWSLIYQQTTSGMPDSPFPQEKLETAKDRELAVGIAPPGGIRIMGIDPALVGPAATAVVHLDPNTGIRRIIHCEVRTNLRGQQQIHEWATEIASRYDCQEARVERNSQQSGYWNDATFMQQMSAIGTRVHTEWTGLNKYDDDVGVMWLASVFDRGLYRIPWQGSSPGVMQALVDELSLWRPGARITQDRVMALHLAERGCKQWMLGSGNPKVQNKAPAWAQNKTRAPWWVRQKRLRVGRG